MHKPTVRDIYNIRADQAVRDSTVGVIRAIDALRQVSAPEVVVNVARNLFPGLPDLEAVAELQMAIEKAVREMTDFKILAQEAVRAEEVRSKTTRIRATNRLSEIAARIPRLKLSIASAESNAEKKIKSLTDLGASPEEAAQITGDCGAAADRAELEKISADKLKLEAYIRTWNEDDLPAGIVQPAATQNPEAVRE